MNDLEAKIERASDRMYGWNEGYCAGYLHAMNQHQARPKNPWTLLIFRHYCKRWYRGER